MVIGEEDETSVFSQAIHVYFSKNYAVATGYPVLNNKDNDRLQDCSPIFFSSSSQLTMTVRNRILELNPPQTFRRFKHQNIHNCKVIHDVLYPLSRMSDSLLSSSSSTPYLSWDYLL